MTELKRETVSGLPGQESAIRNRSGSRLPLVFLGMLIVGTAGRLTLDGRWVEAVANHLAGLGVVGLLACLAAYIAKKKRRDPRTAFLWGSLLPIVLGIIAVIVVHFTTGYVYCGGGVILAASLLVIVVYACVRKGRTVHA